MDTSEERHLPSDPGPILPEPTLSTADGSVIYPFVKAEYKHDLYFALHHAACYTATVHERELCLRLAESENDRKGYENRIKGGRTELIASWVSAKRRELHEIVRGTRLMQRGLPAGNWGDAYMAQACLEVDVALGDFGSSDLYVNYSERCIDELRYLYAVDDLLRFHFAGLRSTWAYSCALDVALRHVQEDSHGPADDREHVQEDSHGPADDPERWESECHASIRAALAFLRPTTRDIRRLPCSLDADRLCEGVKAEMTARFASPRVKDFIRRLLVYSEGSFDDLEELCAVYANIIPEPSLECLDINIGIGLVIKFSSALLIAGLWERALGGVVCGSWITDVAFIIRETMPWVRQVISRDTWVRDHIINHCMQNSLDVSLGSD